MSDKSPVSDLEIDLLHLFYCYSDQMGRVDTVAAADYAQRRLGYIISKKPFTLDQRHIDLLMDRGDIPDTRLIFSKF